MFVDITEGSVALTEPNDFSRFHVQVAQGLTDDRVTALLADTGAGAFDGADHVAVDVAWIRAAARGTPDEWTDRFEQLLAYAGSKGWLTPGGSAVRGHIVRV